jgi:4-hydroxy-tetrahydrodipicolinate synthase
MIPHEHFKGTGVALVTPFRHGKIDWEGYERIIEHVTEGGVEFLVVLGTTGESATTTDAEHRQILDFTIRTNRGRLPVVAGVFGGNNTAALVEKVEQFDFDGIDAILASSPAYNKPGQEGNYRHYMALAEASPRPIIIYNVPSRTSCNLTAETTLRLAHGNEKFIAIKEASDDMLQVMRIIKGRPENFLVLSGDDFLTLPIITAGGDGVISVIANATPRPFTDMVRAGLRHDLATAQPLNLLLLEFYKLLFLEGNPAGVKAALELLGLCSRELRLPLVEMTAGGVEQIRTELEKIVGKAVRAAEAA